MIKKKVVPEKEKKSPPKPGVAKEIVKKDEDLPAANGYQKGEHGDYVQKIGE